MCGLLRGREGERTIACCFSRTFAWPCSQLSARAQSPCPPRQRSTCAPPEEVETANRRAGEPAKSPSSRLAVSPFRSSSLLALQHCWAPIRLLQTSGASVFEEFVHRREHHSGSLHVQAHIEIEFVIEKMDVAMTEHAKERAVCVEIVGMNNSLINLEVCGCFVRDAVSAAGEDPVQNS